MAKVNLFDVELYIEPAGLFRVDLKNYANAEPLNSEDIKNGQQGFFSVEPGEIALCDYSKPPDISCRRVKTMGEVSDGFHTFDELYAHRIELWMIVCSQYPESWRSKLHSDGSTLDGWFVLGIGRLLGTQMTYHLPIDRWDDCDWAETLDRAPEFDGHTSADVLERLKKL